MNRGHEAIRMCVICRRRAPKEELLRHVFEDGDKPLVDEPQTRPGRGWYLCSEHTCREKFRRFRPSMRKCKGGRG